jgi:hypothetical protein
MSARLCVSVVLMVKAWNNEAVGGDVESHSLGLRLVACCNVARMKLARLRAASLSGVQNRFLPSERSSRTSCCERRSLQQFSLT